MIMQVYFFHKLKNQNHRFKPDGSPTHSFLKEGWSNTN